MNDSEIAEALALAMGKRELAKFGVWFMGDIHLDPLNKWSPAIRWDHVGIVIEWMESKGHWLDIATRASNLRNITWPLPGEFQVWPKISFNGPLTPRHICLSVLAALEPDCICVYQTGPGEYSLGHCKVHGSVMTKVEEDEI